MDVDEAGSDSESPRVDLFLSASRQLWRDLRDQGATQGDVGLDSFGSCSVENGPAADYEVVIGAVEEDRWRVSYSEKRTRSSGYESPSVRFQAGLGQCWVAWNLRSGPCSDHLSATAASSSTIFRMRCCAFDVA